MEAPEEGPPPCKPETDIKSLGAQLGELIVTSAFKKEVYGDIVDYAMVYVAERTPGMETAEEEEYGGSTESEYAKRRPSFGAPMKSDPDERRPTGFQESIRQMVRKVLAEHERLDPDLKLTDDQAPFVLRRSGAAADKEFFRILKRKGRTLIPAWSPLENAHKYKTADAAMDGKYRVEQHGHIPVTIVPIADVLTELEEARETAAQRTKRERAESKRKTQKKKADPRVQAVDRASQAHIAKEKEKREEREKKAKEEK